MKINLERLKNIGGGIGGSLFVASIVATFFLLSIPIQISIFGFTLSLILIMLSIIDFKIGGEL